MRVRELRHSLYVANAENKEVTVQDMQGNDYTIEGLAYRDGVQILVRKIDK